MTDFIVRQNGVEKTMVASRQGSEISVELDGKTAVFQLLEQGKDGILVQRTLPDGTQQQWRLVGHKDGDKRTLWLNGRTHHYERVLPRGGGPSHQGSLAATIPAVVAEILVSLGDEVTAGDKLLLLESMKMIIPIQAPYDGIVTALNCTQGESVPAGIPLIEVEQIEG